jgi:hypothetical protein
MTIFLYWGGDRETAEVALKPKEIETTLQIDLAK